MEKRKPRLTCTILVGVERSAFDALEQLAATTSPPQSKSALCREAIYALLAHHYRQGFRPNNAINPNKSTDNSEIIPAAAE